jgi:hypothetical protein
MDSPDIYFSHSGGKGSDREELPVNVLTWDGRAPLMASGAEATLNKGATTQKPDLLQNLVHQCVCLLRIQMRKPRMAKG